MSIHVHNGRSVVDSIPTVDWLRVNLKLPHIRHGCNNVTYWWCETAPPATASQTAVWRFAPLGVHMRRVVLAGAQETLRRSGSGGTVLISPHKLSVEVVLVEVLVSRFL